MAKKVEHYIFVEYENCFKVHAWTGRENLVSGMDG